MTWPKKLRSRLASLNELLSSPAPGAATAWRKIIGTADELPVAKTAEADLAVGRFVRWLLDEDTRRGVEISMLLCPPSGDGTRQTDYTEPAATVLAALAYQFTESHR